MAVVTPPDHPKSVRNRWVIEVFVLSLCILEFSVDVRAFVIGLSQISSISYLHRIGSVSIPVLNPCNLGIKGRPMVR